MFAEACAQGLGGRDRQARRLRLHRQALQGLAEVQVRAGPGAGDRRLHRRPGLARWSSARCSSASTRATALHYAGKVGTGFDRETLQGPRRRGCARCARDDPPFSDAPRFRDVTWVEPELVAQFGFAEWTSDGRLRHPRFLGLREDKDPLEGRPRGAA